MSLLEDAGVPRSMTGTPLAGAAGAVLTPGLNDLALAGSAGSIALTGMLSFKT